MKVSPSYTSVTCQSPNQYKQKRINIEIEMKLTVNIVLLLCVVNSITAVKRKKCGILVDKCELLTSGKVFWSQDYATECNHIPICPSGYRLHKQMLGKLRACCCVLKHLSNCPDCDMTKYTTRQSFFEWIEMHLDRNGPQDGLCAAGLMKRIFFGGPKRLDKCCCEPRDSPFIYQYEAQR
jgi:hypothetical protein